MKHTKGQGDSCRRATQSSQQMAYYNPFNDSAAEWNISPQATLSDILSEDDGSYL